MQPNQITTAKQRSGKVAPVAKDNKPELTKDNEIVLLSQEVQAFPATVAPIKTPQQYEEAADKLKRIKAAIAQIEAKRVLYTKPLNDTVKNINQDAKDSKAPWERAETAFKNALIAYNNEQLRLQREEQQRQNQLAQQQQDRLNKQAEQAAASGNAGRAELLQERASQVVAPVINRAPPKVSGISIREVWKFEVNDINKVPREYLMVDETKVRGVVNSLKADAKIEGIRVYQDQQMAAGAA